MMKVCKLRGAIHSLHHQRSRKLPLVPAEGSVEGHEGADTVVIGYSRASISGRKNRQTKLLTDYPRRRCPGILHAEGKKMRSLIH